MDHISTQQNSLSFFFLVLIIFSVKLVLVPIHFDHEVLQNSQNLTPPLPPCPVQVLPLRTHCTYIPEEKNGD